MGKEFLCNYMAMQVLHGHIITDKGVNMIFETHAHYDDAAFDTDREELLGSMREHGIGCIINVCADMDSLDKTVKLMTKYPFIYGAFGLHPDEVGAMDETVMAKLRGLLALERAVAVGEIGLDYHWDVESHEKQRYWFLRQIELARESGHPVIVHSREAAADTLSAIREGKAAEVGGVLHSYSYSKELAREYLNMGFYLGVGGVVTFKNAKKIKEVVEYAPLDRILLETDSPYLAPVPFRGKRNSSLNLPLVVSQIAAIKGVSEEEVIRVTENNARKLFVTA